VLKQDLMDAWKRPRDIVVLGYTCEEEDRLDNFRDRNPDRAVLAPLVDAGLSKEDCKAMVRRAGIELPLMYRLGYDNANCIGCVKGGKGYWNKIRIDFPEHFDRMAKLEKNIGAKILQHKGERIWLEDLPKGVGHYPSEQAIECGIFCELAEGLIK
jgi:hypothetical protein